MTDFYPFHPIEDSLFGESFFKVWVDLGMNEKSFFSALQDAFLKESILNGWPDSEREVSKASGFYCTRNSVKEVIFHSVPQKLRRYLQTSDTSSCIQLLKDIGQGNLESQSYPGLDILFEILEWLLTGFEDRSMLEEFLHETFPALFERQKECPEYKLICQLEKHYKKNFLR